MERSHWFEPDIIGHQCEKTRNELGMAMKGQSRKKIKYQEGSEFDKFREEELTDFSRQFEKKISKLRAEKTELIKK
jgi:hypothetical protein